MSKPNFTTAQKIIGFTAGIIVRLIRLTLNWEYRCLYQGNFSHWSHGEPVIIAFWHNQQIFMPWIYRSYKSKLQKPLYAIVSRHGDGRLAASLLENLSIRTIAGSSNDGGKAAFKEMCSKIKAGNHIAITPDGPTGPAEKAKMGAVKLASISGAKILPVALNTKSKWTFNSWDKIFIPKPFSKTLLVIGEAISVKADLSKKELLEATRNLTEELNSLNLKVKSELGLT